MSTPAQLLNGHTINGWDVGQRIEIFQGQTGGRFSTGYFVTKGDKRAFLKAMDLHEAIRSGLREVELATRQYNFERELLCLCRDKRLSHIVQLVDHGEYKLETLPTGQNDLLNRVYYMIFELADGDVRRELAFDGTMPASRKVHVLHQIAVALTQLHTIEIAHQDVKPSNVLSFKNLKRYKLSDLGRSAARNITAPTDNCPFPGDMNYAPPEYLYGFIPGEYHDRRLGSDAYLLGSMIPFLFIGLGAISATIQHLPTQYLPGEWKGGYQEALPFLLDAHIEVVSSLKTYLPEKYREELATIYFQLCHPDPSSRGHPTARALHGRQIGLERYVSRFDAIEKGLYVHEKISTKVNA